MSPTLSPPNLPNDIRRGNWRLGRAPGEHEDILIFLLFPPVPLSLPPSPCCSSSLIREGGLTSPAAGVWLNGWLGALKTLLGMHCPWVQGHVFVCVHVHIAYTTVSTDWGRTVCLIRAAGWVWLTHVGPSQAVKAMALRGGPFHLHCPSQGSPSRRLGIGVRLGCY